MKQVQVSRLTAFQCRVLTRQQEYYADYWALDSSLVSLEVEHNASCFMPSKTWEVQVRHTHEATLVFGNRSLQTDADNATRLRPHRGGHLRSLADSEETAGDPLLANVRCVPPWRPIMLRPSLFWNQVGHSAADRSGRQTGGVRAGVCAVRLSPRGRGDAAARSRPARRPGDAAPFAVDVSGS